MLMQQKYNAKHLDYLGSRSTKIPLQKQVPLAYLTE